MGSTECSPVLAKYDFRSKQQYIYRTNALREIAGASAIITDAYDGFLDECIRNGWKIGKHYTLSAWPDRYYLNSADEPFEPDFEENDGEVICVGGGNLYILWKNRETALEANRLLCSYLRNVSYGLSPVCGLAKYTGDYDLDIGNLNMDFDWMKGTVPPVQFSAVLPFTLLDRNTGLPVAEKRHVHGETMELSAESACKLNKYETLASGFSSNEEELDRIVTEKGKESLLAVIYIDGNNMGARVREAMRPGNEGIHDYAVAVRTIRQLSNTVQERFVSSPRKAIEAMLNGKNSRYRFVVAGGDEITLICNAREALNVVQTYFDDLDTNNREGESYHTACAGICVFHSHYPFSSAYAVAEECCENAKKANRACGGHNCLVDFQHCFGGNVGDLIAMREKDRADLLLRPYLCRHYGEDRVPLPPALSEYMERGRKLSGLGRHNIKALSGYLVSDPARYETEIQRLGARYPDVSVDGEDKRFLHDIAQFYDIWFGKEE